MKRSYIILGIAFVSFIVLYITLRLSGFIDIFNPEQIKSIILGYGPWAPILYIALYVIACVLFIPGSPLTLAGGALFGPLYGTIYTVIGATLGATLAFCISRYLGRGIINERKGNVALKLKAYDAKIASHGFFTVLFLRFVPLFPFNGLNFGLGLTNVSFKDYVLGTFLGIIPGTYAYVYFGDSLASLNITKILIAFVIVIVLSLAGKQAIKMYHR